MIRILYHTDSDGYAAAYAVRRYLETEHHPDPPPEMFFWSMGYGSRLPEIDYDKDTVFMVDYSLQPDEKMVEFAKKLGNRLIWFDHHDTAVQMQDRHDELKIVPGVRMVEDENGPLCGCELAWTRLMPTVELPAILRIVGDWDTWRWKKMPELDQFKAKAFQHYFRTYDFDPRTTEGYYRWKNMDYMPALQEALSVGRTLIQYQENEWKRTVGWLSFEAELGGYRAILVNRSGSSEMFKGYYNPEKHDIMVCFSLVKGKNMTVSMYSDKDHIHLGELAEKLGTEGGGGHRGAAGFQCSWEHLWSLIRR